MAGRRGKTTTNKADKTTRGAISRRLNSSTSLHSTVTLLARFLG